MISELVKSDKQKRMMKKLLIFIICICGAMASMQAQNMGAARKLQMAEFAIANLYVDSVDENKLVEEAIIRMLAQLDPHSTYNDAEEVKKMNEPLQGNFEGIGVQFHYLLYSPSATDHLKRLVFWQVTVSWQ